MTWCVGWLVVWTSLEGASRESAAWESPSELRAATRSESGEPVCGLGKEFHSGRRAALRERVSDPRRISAVRNTPWHGRSADVDVILTPHVLEHVPDTARALSELFRVIAPGALEPMENSPTKLVVRSALADDGSVKSAADLKGRRVAVAGGPGSGGEYLISKGLSRGNLTIRDVELMNVANPDMPMALANGSVDAALMGSPYADQVINAGDAKVLESDLTPGLMTVAFVGSGKFVNERPEVAERFVLALAEAAAMMQGDDYLAPENIEAYLTFTNSTEDAIRSGNPVIYDPTMQIPVAGLADMEKVHRENGRTEYTDPLDLSNAVDTSFTEKARAALGL